MTTISPTYVEMRLWVKEDEITVNARWRSSYEGRLCQDVECLEQCEDNIRLSLFGGYPVRVRVKDNFNVYQELTGSLDHMRQIKARLPASSFEPVGRDVYPDIDGDFTGTIYRGVLKWPTNSTVFSQNMIHPK